MASNRKFSGVCLTIALILGTFTWGYAKDKDTDAFPNWMGEVNLGMDNAAQKGEGFGSTRSITASADVTSPLGALTKTVVSWKPRLFTLEGLVSEDECDYLIAKSQGQLEAFDKPKASGIGVARFERADDDIIHRIMNRIATITMVPLYNFDKLEILKYEDGASYGKHSDLIPGIVDLEPGTVQVEPPNVEKPGQIVAKVFITLKAPKAGGHMLFENARVVKGGKEWGGDHGPNCKADISFTPKKTDVVLLHTMATNGLSEWKKGNYSVCATEGEMWTAVVTLNAYDHGKCDDFHLNCASWAAQGLCQANEPYMIGRTGEFPAIGHCRKSCKACTS